MLALTALLSKWPLFTSNSRAGGWDWVRGDVEQNARAESNCSANDSNSLENGSDVRYRP